MSVLQALLLGVIQGVTEFLPVSSSGHLVIASNLLNLPTQSNQLLFDVILHLATLGAITFFFFHRIKKLSWNDLLLIGIATVPAVLFGLAFEAQIESFFRSSQIVGFTLIITGLINFRSHYLLKTNRVEKKLKIKNALVIGLFQAMALIPGISRSGSTLVGGLSNNLSRKKAFEFSFLLAIPAILGANLLQLLKLTQNELLSLDWLGIAVGSIAAFIFGIVSLSLLKKMISSAKLHYFGWYAVSVGLLTLFFFN